MSAREWGVAGLLLLALVWMVLIQLLRPKATVEEPRAEVVSAPRRPSIDDDPTEYVVREPAIYTDREPTVPVNIRQPQPWEWAK